MHPDTVSETQRQRKPVLFPYDSLTTGYLRSVILSFKYERVALFFFYTIVLKWMQLVVKSECMIRLERRLPCQETSCSSRGPKFISQYLAVHDHL